MYIICIYVDIVTVCHSMSQANSCSYRNIFREKRLRGGGCFELSPEHRGFQVTCGVDQTGMALSPKKDGCWLGKIHSLYIFNMYMLYVYVHICRYIFNRSESHHRYKVEFKQLCTARHEIIILKAGKKTVYRHRHVHRF